MCISFKYHFLYSSSPIIFRFFEIFFSCFEGTRLLITRCLDKQLRWKRIALLRKFCKSNVWPCRTNVCVWLNFKLEVINRVLTIKIFLSLLSNSSAVSFKMKINKSESNLTPRKKNYAKNNYLNVEALQMSSSSIQRCRKNAMSARKNVKINIWTVSCDASWLWCCATNWYVSYSCSIVKGDGRRT